MVPFHFMWGSPDNWFFQSWWSRGLHLHSKSDSAYKKYTVPWKLALPFSQKTEHCFVMKMIFAWSQQKKKKKTRQDKILYHSFCHQNCSRTGDTVDHSGKVARSLYKMNILEADAFKTELHTSIARRKLGLVFLTMTPQYQPHIWFSQSALVCSSWSGCFWTHVIRHGHLTLFNSSLQHLCATIKVYPQE